MALPQECTWSDLTVLHYVLADLYSMLLSAYKVVSLVRPTLVYWQFIMISLHCWEGYVNSGRGNGRRRPQPLSSGKIHRPLVARGPVPRVI